jgi:hypothetical protein
VLLIESVEASGACARDAHTRARALLHAGCEVRSAVVEPQHDASLDPVPDHSRDGLVVRADMRGRRRLREWIGESAADLVIVASAVAGGGEAGKWVSRIPGLKAWWWPTGLCGRSDDAEGQTTHARDMGSMLRPGPLAPLPIDRGRPAVAGEPWPGACMGLESSVFADARVRRGQLPLWDGEYVLAPMALSLPSAHSVIDAFAAICEAHDGLDLVVLTDPQPVFERYARERGVGFRVHFAGAARRDAELAWLNAAAAAVIAGDAPLSGGFVLRAIESGCPLLAAPGAATGTPLEAWLGAHGLRVGAAGDSLQARLERALAGDAVPREAARALAAGHTLDRMADRLAFALDAVAAAQRAA